MEKEIKTNADGKEVAMSTKLTIDRSNGQTLECKNVIVPLDDLLENYEVQSNLRTIANAGLQDSDSKQFIVDASKLFASVFDNLKNAFKDEGCIDKLSEISKKFHDDPEIGRFFHSWCKSRKEMIGITKSAAIELDQPVFMVNISRIMGSFIEILHSLNLGIYDKMSLVIVSYANTISPNLGFVLERALELAPHLRFMGFASSFFDILRTQVIIGRVVRALKKDKEMFTPLKKWFDETKELDESVKKLFPYGIDKEITLSIEKALEDMGKEEKIFSATFLSNLMEDPMIHKNGKFMAEVFLFCRSDAAKVWYERLILGACSSDLECDMLSLRTQIQQLEGVYADSASKMEMGKCTVGQMENAKNCIKTNLGRLVIIGMSGMSVYCCYQNIRDGSKHRYSDILRELSKNAQSFLNTMEKIRL